MTGVVVFFGTLIPICIALVLFEDKFIK